jgi:hypothetical protein
LVPAGRGGRHEYCWRISTSQPVDVSQLKSTTVIVACVIVEFFKPVTPRERRRGYPVDGFASFLSSLNPLSICEQKDGRGWGLLPVTSHMWHCLLYRKWKGTPFGYFVLNLSYWKPERELLCTFVNSTNFKGFKLSFLCVTERIKGTHVFWNLLLFFFKKPFLEHIQIPFLL